MSEADENPDTPDGQADGGQLAVVLCCDENSLPTVAEASEAIETRGHTVELVTGLELDTELLTAAIARFQAGALYVLCRTEALNRQKVDELRNILRGEGVPFSNTLTLALQPGKSRALEDRVVSVLRRMSAGARTTAEALPVSRDVPQVPAKRTLKRTLVFGAGPVPSPNAPAIKSSSMGASLSRDPTSVAPVSKLPPPDPSTAPIRTGDTAVVNAGVRTGETAVMPAAVRSGGTNIGPAPSPPNVGDDAATQPKVLAVGASGGSETEPQKDVDADEVAAWADSLVQRMPEELLQSSDMIQPDAPPPLSAAAAVSMTAAAVPVEDAVPPPPPAGIIPGPGGDTPPELVSARVATPAPAPVAAPLPGAPVARPGDPTSGPSAPALGSDSPVVSEPGASLSARVAATWAGWFPGNPARAAWIAGGSVVGVLALTTVVCSVGGGGGDDVVAQTDEDKADKDKADKDKAAKDKAAKDKAAKDKAAKDKADEPEAKAADDGATPAEDPPAEDPPSEDPPAEDPPADATPADGAEGGVADPPGDAPPSPEIDSPEVTAALATREVRALDVLLVADETSGNLNYAGAVAYCQGLSLGGLGGWRLPEIGELNSLVAGKMMKSAVYWSDTKGDTFGDTRMVVNSKKKKITVSRREWKGSKALCVRGRYDPS